MNDQERDLIAILRNDKIPDEMFNQIIDKNFTKIHTILMPRTIYIDDEIPPLTLKIAKSNLSKVFTDLINRPFDLNKPWYPIN